MPTTDQPTGSTASTGDKVVVQPAPITDRQFRRLKRIYSDCLRSIDQFKEFVDDYNAERHSVQVQVQLEQLEDVRSEFISARRQLLHEDDCDEDALVEEYKQFNKTFIEVKGFLKSNLHPEAIMMPAASSTILQTSTYRPKVRLPEINLPSFDGDVTKWLTFKDRFTSMVHEVVELSDVTKLQYLLTALKGDAATLYDHTQLIAENYDITWKSLHERYDDSKRIKREHFKALYQLEPMNGSSVEELSRLVNETKRLVRGMERTSEPVKHWDTPLTSLVIYKFDPKTLLAWEQHSADQEADSYKELMIFCEKQIKILNSCTMRNKTSIDTKPAKTVSGVRNQIPRSKKDNATSLACSVQTTNPSVIVCPVCKADHVLSKCSSFSTMDRSQRQEQVKEHRLCFNCLRSGHSIRFCRSHSRCEHCKRRHHSLLCDKNASAVSETQVVPISATLQDGSKQERKMIWLSTAQVLVSNWNGEPVPARALLDMGAQSNFITERLAQQLKLRKTRVQKPLFGVGTVALTSSSTVTTTVKSVNSSHAATLEFLVLTSVTADFPPRSIDVQQWNIPSGFVLADPGFNKREKIDLLLGAEIFAELLEQGQLSLAPNLPRLLKTKLGWIVSGKMITNPEDTNQYDLACCSVMEERFNNSMDRLVSLENLPEERIPSEDDIACMKHYEETTRRSRDGRYIVTLPKLPQFSTLLGESREIALRRFLAIERRMRREKELNDAYKEFMQEYISLGHMSCIGTYSEFEGKSSEVAYYLPHHAVWKAGSSTTRCRVVFDASCKTSSGRSLNDVLITGPQIQENIICIQLRFRMKKIAVVADVAKMYRQVLVDDNDKALQRILWRDHSGEQLRVYELKTVTYGTACAPFLAVRTLQRIFEDHGSKYPKALACKRDFYVDDLLSGADSVQEAREMADQLNKLMNEGQFCLRKWASNHHGALIGIPSEQHATGSQLELATEQDSISTLGLVWTPSKDTLKVQVRVPSEVEVKTKTHVLSCIARLYDPLGFLDPVKMRAKLIMQTIWALKDAEGKPWSWDKELPKPISQEWSSFVTQLKLLEDVKIPRLAVSNSAEQYQLHIFCDASEKGYGACCYVRSLAATGTVVVHLLISKSKVAPLSQRMTIARLELCGALLGSRLYSVVKEALVTDVSCYMWTDSLTTWHWIQSPHSRWKTFVANRTAKIQALTRGVEWRHVPGKENPSDLASRGCDPEEFLQQSALWWSGPGWLSQSEDQWPEPPVGKLTIVEEQRATTLLVMSEKEESFSDRIFSRYSTYAKLRRVIAYCLRYIAALRKQNHQGESTALTSEELRHAEDAICRIAQRDSFAEELKTLGTGKNIATTSLLKGCNVTVDDKGILRVQTRIGNAKLSEDVKYPIVIAKRHALAKLLAEHYHAELLHAGPQLMITTIRQRFWIMGARSVVRRAYHQCIRCFKSKPKLIIQPMAPLPTTRVNKARPFAISGVDYCGPVMIKAHHRRAAPTKAFIAVFVCFVTRAVHLELVSDLSTAAFLAALRRFVSRRGAVSEINSDNGTNFKGAANELQRLHELLQSSNHKEAITNWTAERGIKWKFIPPRAPHFGGLWEAAVRSMKYHLIRVLGTAAASYEDLTTLLTEIEACLNSRPLTELSADSTDLEALTPGHFLTGSHLKYISEIDLKDIPENRLNHWRVMQQRLQHFWSRWQREYLQQLRARTKWHNPAVPIKPGMLVILHEDNMPPMKWPLARITEVHPGKDGVVRVVTLRTAQASNVKRPVVKLSILPTEN